ncbi:MAG TPA: hypothetical protein PKE63_11885, partial [Lacibacter sp.]|nr:hypothetical protein [Lacibacter sp.]
MDKNPWDTEQEQGYLHGPAVSLPRKSTNVWDIQYRRVLSVWPWMIPAGLLFWAAAWFYLRYQDDVYRVSASIVLQDPAFAVMNPYSSRDPINDNIARLRSPTLMKRVVDTMGLQYKAMVKGNIKDRDIYDDIRWYKPTQTPTNSPALSFEVIQTNEAGFRWKSGNQEGTAAWSVPFEISGHPVVVQKKSSSVPTRFLCFESDPWNTAFGLTASLGVTSSKISNVVELSMMDVERQRAADIINTLIQIYNFSLLTEKRKSQEQALRFIGERLEPLARQVDSIEEVLARFKAEKGIILKGDYLNKILGYQEDIERFRLKERVLRNSEQYFRRSETQADQLALPGVEDNTTQQLISQLLGLWSEREKLALTVTEQNPRLQLLDKQIDAVRKNLDKQLENYKQINRITEEFTRNRQSDAASKFSLSPFEEKR